MYQRDDIETRVKTLLQGTSYFLVEVSISLQNKIVVTFDGPDGVKLDACVELSRKINAVLDRDVEDYELEVSSPGLTKPFKVIEQYKKNIGEEVEVLKRDGIKICGTLKSVATNGFEIQWEGNTKKPRLRKKETIVNTEFIEFETIKHTKKVINF